MTKLVKGLTALILATILATGMIVSANAAYDQNEYSSFTWDTSSCTIKNTTNTSRYMTAGFVVYEKNTGAFVNSSFGSGNGAYGTTASANNPVTHNSQYNYVWNGAIYNGGHPNSGILASYVKPLAQYFSTSLKKAA